MGKKNTTRSILYTNFTPYENTGKIRDYILETYTTAIIFVFNFHRLTKLEQPSMVSVYRRGRRVFQARLFQTPYSTSLAFFLLPLRSCIIFLQILFHTYRLRKRFGPFDDFFTVNAFIAWTGIIIKKLGLVKRTIFWVWDYYPPVHKSKMVMFMRWMYWYFDKAASKYSNRVAYVNLRMVSVRKKLNVLHEDHTPLIIPIGTSSKSTRRHRDPFSCVFLGVLKQSQGLKLFFDSIRDLTRVLPKLKLHVIGGGPDEQLYRNLATKTNIPVYFHGYVTNEAEVDRILATSSIGIAPYMPDPSNVSYWGDPSKIKRYLSVGIPVVTTNVFEFSRQIQNLGCGIVIPYTPEPLTHAVINILKHYSRFQSAALTVARRYRYKMLYRPMFE